MIKNNFVIIIMRSQSQYLKLIISNEYLNIKITTNILKEKYNETSRCVCVYIYIIVNYYFGNFSCNLTSSTF